MLRPGDKVLTKEEICTFDAELKPGTAVTILSRMSNGDYVVSYTIFGVQADELESEPFYREVNNNATR